MKCKKCGKDVFPGQFRCDHCGVINPTEENKETKKKPVTRAKKTIKED